MNNIFKILFVFALLGLILPAKAQVVKPDVDLLWEALTYGGAVAAETYASFVRVTTSTPNYAVYALRDFAKAMKVEGMRCMADFKDLRGQRIPFPKI